MNMNQHTEKDTERRNAVIDKLRDRFGAYFREIEAETGFEMEKIITTSDTRVLERLLHQKEILVEEKSFLSVPGVERIEIPSGYSSFRLVKLHQGDAIEGKAWDSMKYHVKSVPDPKDPSHSIPVVISVKRGTDINLSIGSGDQALTVTLPAGSEEAEAWRLCKRGVKAVANDGREYLLTPSKWDNHRCAARCIDDVRDRIRKCIKRSQETPLSFRTFSREQGKLFNSFAPFSLSQDAEGNASVLDTLAAGGEVLLVNGKGEKTCVHFDCSENQLAEALPLELAKKVELSKLSNLRRERSVNQSGMKAFSQLSSQKTRTPASMRMVK